MSDILDAPEMNGAQFKDQASDVAAPSSGFKRVFSKAAGLFMRNSAGTVTQIAELNGSSVLTHEVGGLEADVSAGDGFVEIKSGSTTVIKSNATTSNPGVSDDNTAGYAVFSQWINTSTGAVYMCTDASTGAANWTLLG